MRTTLLNQKVTKPQRLKALRQLGDNKQQLNSLLVLVCSRAKSAGNEDVSGKSF